MGEISTDLLTSHDHFQPDTLVIFLAACFGYKKIGWAFKVRLVFTTSWKISEFWVPKFGMKETSRESNASNYSLSTPQNQQMLWECFGVSYIDKMGRTNL